MTRRDVAESRGGRKRVMREVVVFALVGACLSIVSAWIPCWFVTPEIMLGSDQAKFGKESWLNRAFNRWPVQATENSMRKQWLPPGCNDVAVDFFGVRLVIGSLTFEHTQQFLAAKDFKSYEERLKSAPQGSRRVPLQRDVTASFGQQKTITGFPIPAMSSQTCYLLPHPALRVPVVYPPHSLSPSAFEMGIPEWELAWTGFPPKTNLPLEPWWPGFVLNTCIWAAVSWGGRTSWTKLRNRQRVAANRCKRCGHSLAGHAPCTECGEASGKQE
jgi:hypothetical protein